MKKTAEYLEGAKKQAEAAAVESQAQSVKEPISFHLGEVLLEAVKSSVKMLALPVAFWKIHKGNGSRLSSKALREEIVARGPLFQAMLKILQESGLPALREHFSSLKLSITGQVSALSALAKEAHPGAPLRAIEAAGEAQRLDPKPYRAKWLAFRLFEQGFLPEAAELLTDQAAGSEFSESEKKRAAEILSKFEKNRQAPKATQKGLPRAHFQKSGRDAKAESAGKKRRMHGVRRWHPLVCNRQSRITERLFEADIAISDGRAEFALINLLQMYHEGCADVAARLLAIGAILTRDPYLADRLAKMLNEHIPLKFDCRQGPAGLDIPTCYRAETLAKTPNAGSARLLAIHLLERCLSEPQELVAKSKKADVIYLLRTPNGLTVPFLAHLGSLAQAGHNVIIFADASELAREHNLIVFPLPQTFDQFRAQLLGALGRGPRKSVAFATTPLDFPGSVLEHLFLEDTGSDILSIVAHPPCEHFVAAGPTEYNVPQCRLIPGAFAARNFDCLASALWKFETFDEIERYAPESLQWPIPVQDEETAGIRDLPAYVIVSLEGSADASTRPSLAFPPNTRFLEAGEDTSDMRRLVDKITKEIDPGCDTIVAFWDQRLTYSPDHFIRAYDLFCRRGGNEALSLLPIRYFPHEQRLHVEPDSRIGLSRILLTAGALFDLEYMRTRCAFASEAVVVAGDPVFARQDSADFYEQNRTYFEDQLLTSPASKLVRDALYCDHAAPLNESPTTPPSGAVRSNSGIEMLRRHQASQRRRLFQIIAIWDSDEGRPACLGNQGSDAVLEFVATKQSVLRMFEWITPDEFLLLFRFIFKSQYCLQQIGPDVKVLFFKAGVEMGLQCDLAKAIIKNIAPIVLTGYEMMIPAFEMIVSGASREDFSKALSEACSILTEEPSGPRKPLFRLGDVLRRFGGMEDILTFIKTLRDSAFSDLLDDPVMRGYIGEALLSNASVEKPALPDEFDSYCADDFTKFSPPALLLIHFLELSNRGDFLCLLERNAGDARKRPDIFDALRDHSEAIARLQVTSRDFFYEALCNKSDELRLAILLNDKTQMEAARAAVSLLDESSTDCMLASERLGDSEPINGWYRRKCSDPKLREMGGKHGVISCDFERTGNDEMTLPISSQRDASAPAPVPLPGVTPVRFGAPSLPAFFESVLSLRPPGVCLDGPLVTVVMTVFNPDIALMHLAIQSVLEQTYKNIELIIVDDGGDEPVSEEIAARFGGHASIQVLACGQNRGPYVARNQAIAAAKGRYLAIQDADDCSHPERMELQVSVMENDPGVQLVTTEHMRLDQSGRIQFEKDFRLSGDGTMSSAFRMDTLKMLGGFCPVRSRGDVEMRERIKGRFGAGSIAHLECPLVFCGASPSSLSKATSRNYRGFLQLFRANLETQIFPRITRRSPEKPAVPWPLRPEFVQNGQRAKDEAKASPDLA